MFHIGNQVPWCASWVLGRTRYRDRLPRDQSAPIDNGHEGRSYPQYLPRPPSDVWRPGKGQLSRDTGKVRCGPQGNPDFLGVLWLSHKGGKVHGLLWSPLQWLPCFNPRIIPVPHNIQCGSGISHPTLGDSGVGNKGGRVGNRCVGAGPCVVFIHGQQTSIVNPDVEVV